MQVILAVNEANCLIIIVTKFGTVGSKKVLPKRRQDDTEEHTRIRWSGARAVFSGVKEGERQDSRRIHQAPDLSPLVVPVLTSLS